MKIVLASGSPRRKEILTEAGYDFVVHTTDCSEDTEETMPDYYVEELSYRKAEAVAREIMTGCYLVPEDDEEVIVVGADTVVAQEDAILGKPASIEEAQAMIRSLAGKSHSVFTGVSILKLIKNGSKYVLEVSETFSEETKVYVKPMTEEEIVNYVAQGESMDKAGAYAIQGAFKPYIERFEGSYNNVVGFPIEAFTEHMEELEGEDSNAV
ncbi:MAG: Maf family protein [Lachnospiraceae bacterium]|nr:Maf family protein [Lachnospiraceae bacterium]